MAWVRFSRILYEAGLAGIPEQKLAIKMEIDTKPPAGAQYGTQIVNRHMIFVVRHHDLPSLLAGKIHALTTRRYAKGRDWYDLLWYGTLRPPVQPNLTLLQNALIQTEGVRAYPAAEWVAQVRILAGAVRMASLAKEVRTSLERPQDATLLTRDNFLSLLERWGETASA